MIEIRNAKIEDVPFIAKMVMMALHITEEENPRLYHAMVELVRDEKSLYYWERAIIAVTPKGVQKQNASATIAEKEGPVGMILAYDGADYHERRMYSFSYKCEDGGPVSEDVEALLAQPDETGEGEWYVDSLAVAPEAQGRGVGKQLLLHSLERARKALLTPTILVDPDNAPAMRLYTSVGFRYKEEMFCFGANYHKMAIT